MCEKKSFRNETIIFLLFLAAFVILGLAIRYERNEYNKVRANRINERVTQTVSGVGGPTYSLSEGKIFDVQVVVGYENETNIKNVKTDLEEIISLIKTSGKIKSARLNSVTLGDSDER